MVFQDSDVAKWLEAAAYSLVNHPDKELEARVDEIISLIGCAQQEDGYLNTYFTVKAPEKKWTNLQEGHELYCSGHMIEAAVAYFEATGKDSLLNIVKKNAARILSISTHYSGVKKRGLNFKRQFASIFLCKLPFNIINPLFETQIFLNKIVRQVNQKGAYPCNETLSECYRHCPLSAKFLLN